MSRHPRDLLDTSAKIRAVLDEDRSDSESDLCDLSECDTSDSYMPSANEVELYIIFSCYLTYF